MDKRYLIVVAVLITFWAGFMVYRHVKSKNESAEFRAKEYARITEVAKKSPKAGLNQMARALKSHYQEKKRYPKSLKQLYPDYIRNKPFVDEIDWHYVPKKDNFLLSKTVVRSQKRMVASVDKRLTPWLQTSSMVAKPTRPAEKKAREAKEAVERDIRISAKSREDFWLALRAKQVDRAAAYSSEGEKVKVTTIPQPEIVTVGKSEAPSPVETKLAGRHLVWKSKDGTLGFGNVEYPATEAQSRFAMGSWYNLKIPEPKAAASSLDKQIERKGGPEAIASDFSARYLVWKGQGGTLGFGNVRYPEKDHVYVFETDTWVRVPKTEVAMEMSPEEMYREMEKKSSETIASELSGQYYVWKDQDGNLGFGNVEAPQEVPVSVYEKDSWIAVEKSPLPRDDAMDPAYWVAESRSPDSIGSGLSNQYFVWKDQDGNLGFGNVEYPEQRDVSYVQVGGKWERVFN